jgi:hypothetical protein
MAFIDQKPFFTEIQGKSLLNHIRPQKRRKMIVYCETPFSERLEIPYKKGE